MFNRVISLILTLLIVPVTLVTVFFFIVANFYFVILDHLEN